jgi:hypothetical protein
MTTQIGEPFITRDQATVFSLNLTPEYGIGASLQSLLAADASRSRSVIAEPVPAYVFRDISAGFPHVWNIANLHRGSFVPAEALAQ